MITFTRLFVLLITTVHAQRWAKAYTAKCDDHKQLVFTDLRLTPCWEMNVIVARDDCVKNNLCKWNRIYSYNCRLYWEDSRDRLYQCVDKLPLDILVESTTKPSFGSTFDTCGGNSNLEKFLGTQSTAGAKKKGQFSRPTALDKVYWKEIATQVRAKNWAAVVAVVDALGDVRACRRVHDGSRILIILGKEGLWRKYSGVIIAMRIEDNALPVGLSGAHGNRDAGTGLQTINVFARSNMFLAIITPYYSTSSKLKDYCQRKRPIADNSHSLEAPFIHVLLGFFDSFPDLSIIEPHRCGSCGAIRVGRSTVGKESTSNSFIRAFVVAAEEYIIPGLSKQAKSRGFKATIHQSALSKIGASSFKSTGNYFSRTAVTGKVMQGIKDVCKGTAVASRDTSRFLHVEQQGGYSVKSYTAWAKAIDSLATTEFMKGRSVW